MLSLPGERVRMTGVYEVTHAGHRAMHGCLAVCRGNLPSLPWVQRVCPFPICPRGVWAEAIAH